ncbi:MAG: hypothetical protein II480_12245 [Bacteroidales bacterium]|jgi:hypothetical protein|nr:hypothetical protein [Bacteroidales bacterium]
MKKILAFIVAIAVILTVANTCAEAHSPSGPPPFAFEVINLDDLRLDYGAKLEHPASYQVDYSQILHPVDLKKTCVPGRIPTFPFVAVISAIGTYTLYGAGAGIVTVGIIYIATNGNRRHLKHAIWGCVTGMVVGGVAKWLSVR